jgi:hypothetical protein
MADSRTFVEGATLATLTPNSHIPYRAHAVPLPCRAALTHTCHAVPLPFSESAVSIVKVRVVAGNIRTASPIVLTDWYASDNNLRGTPHDNRKKPNVGTSPTCHTKSTPRCAVALRSRFQNGMVVAWHGRGMICVNQTRPHRVNQMGKTQSKPLAARHGRGMGVTGKRHGICELTFNL